MLKIEARIMFSPSGIEAARAIHAVSLVIASLGRVLRIAAEVVVEVLLADQHRASGRDTPGAIVQRSDDSLRSDRRWSAAALGPRRSITRLFWPDRHAICDRTLGP